MSGEESGQGEPGTSESGPTTSESGPTGSGPDESGAGGSGSEDSATTEELPAEIGSRPLDADERAELERLRAQVAQLPTTPTQPLATRPPRRLARRIGAIILVILCAVLTLLSVTTRYVRSQILDTDHYMATVTPLGSNPTIQNQVIDAITEAIDAQTHVEALATEALTRLTELTPAERPRLDARIVGLAPVLAGQAESFIRKTVTDFVYSPEFGDLWISVNRQAHERVVNVVTGELRKENAAVTIDDKGTVSLELSPIIEKVKDLLVQRGFSLAGNIPAINRSFVVFQAPQLVRAQNAVRALDRVATILPWLAILVAIAAVGVAGPGRRMRTVTAVGVAVVVAMLLLAIGILVGRSIYLNEVPVDVLNPAAAQAIFDTIAVPLRTALRAVAVLGLVIALVGFLFGGTRASKTVRRLSSQGWDAIDRRRKDRDPSGVEKALWQIRIAVRIAVPTIAALILIFWRYPTAMVVIWTAIIAAVVLVVFEFAIAPARRASLHSLAEATESA